MLVMKLEFGYKPKSQILDIIEHPCPSNPVWALQKTPVVCKPFEDAFELANINPQKNIQVPFQKYTEIQIMSGMIC